MKSLEDIRQFLDISYNANPLQLLNMIEENDMYNDLLHVHQHPESCGLNAVDTARARIRLALYYSNLRQFRESFSVISDVSNTENLISIEPAAPAFINLITGKVLSKTGENLIASEEKFKSAIALFREHNKPAWELNAWINLSGAYVYQKKFFDVFDMRPQIEDLLYVDEEYIHRSIFYTNLAKSYYGVGQISSALDYLDRAEEHLSPYFKKVGLENYIDELRTEYKSSALDQKEEPFNKPSIRTAMPVLHMRHRGAEWIRKNNRDPLYDPELVAEALLPDSSPSIQDEHSIKAVSSRARYFSEKTLEFVSKGYIDSDASGTDSEVESENTTRRKRQSGIFRKIRGHEQNVSSTPINQILILGSGFDMLAGELYRAGHNVRVVEIELNEEAIELKKQIYKNHGLNPDIDCYIGSYLDDHFWSQAISTLNKSEPVLIILEGNIYYLKNNQIDDLFKKINQSFVSPIVCCDYITTEFYNAMCFNDFSQIHHPSHIPQIKPAGDRFRKFASKMGLIWKGHIDSADTLASKHDLEVIHNKSFVKLVKKSGFEDYSGTGRYNRFTVFARPDIAAVSETSAEEKDNKVSIAKTNHFG